MNSTKRAVMSSILVAALAATTGCATAGRRTATGGAAGAIIGAGVGGAAGGGKGAVIGGAIGAVAGGSVGYYLDKQAKELEKVADTKRTENGVLVKMKSDVLFDFDEATLKQDAIPQLQKVGDILAKYPADRIRVEGHTDSIGTERYNEGLSLRRAQAVRELLASRGVREDQVIIIGVGEEKPVATNATADGRAQNRRVQLQITVPPENIKQDKKS